MAVAVEGTTNRRKLSRDQEVLSTIFGLQVTLPTS